MAAAPAPQQRRRRRPGSLERPVNGRLYRGTWLLVALPLLLAAFSVQHPAPLPPPATPSAFDRASASALARDLATNYPNRVPGSAGAFGAASWFAEQLQPYGFHVETEVFRADIPGLGSVPLRNLVAIAPGQTSRKIVVMAHRDDSGAGPGTIANASGTAALVELARPYATQPAAAGGSLPIPAKPSFTLVFLSTDGGAFGNLGATEFVRHSRFRRDIEAVVNLDSIGASGAPRLEFAGDRPRTGAARLLATASAVIEKETGQEATRPSALRQLIDLGFPFSPYAQAPFVARGIPAVTLTAAPDRPPDAVQDTPSALDITRLGQLGVAAQDTVGALDQGFDLSQGTPSFVFLSGKRVLPGWAIELVLIAALLPFFAAVVDLFARCRRRRVRVAPALRSYRSRLGFWAWVGGVFLLFGLAGAWPHGGGRPPSLTSAEAHHWPTALLGLLALVFPGWIVSRERLLPRRSVRPEEELAGYTGALLALCVVALLVVATNPFALVFLLPSLHLWLWLPQVRAHGRSARLGLLAAGFAGPALLVGSFAFRYGLGAHAFWYVAQLFSLGYAPFPAFAIGLAFAAGAAQLAALAGGRYAPYPSPAERNPRGPLRELVRRAVLAERARRRRRLPVRRAPDEERRALEG